MSDENKPLHCGDPNCTSDHKGGMGRKTVLGKMTDPAYASLFEEFKELQKKTLERNRFLTGQRENLMKEFEAQKEEIFAEVKEVAKRQGTFPADYKPETHYTEFDLDLSLVLAIRYEDGKRSLGAALAELTKHLT